MKRILLRLLRTVLLGASAMPALAHPGHGLEFMDALTHPLHALTHFFEELGVPVSPLILLMVLLLGMLAWLSFRRATRTKLSKSGN